MIEFGELKVVERTFTREGGATREQEYNGIKFRRYTSKKGAKAAKEAGETFAPEVEEVFFISNQGWEQLELDRYALTQVLNGKQVLLLVLEDQDAMKPEAKFCRQYYNKEDGSPQKKGKIFSNEFLSKDLISAGVLDADKHGNQFIALVDVTKDINGAPSHVKKVFNLVVDSSVSEETTNIEETELIGVERDF